MTKILIVTSKVLGSGHYSVAKSLQEKLEASGNEVEFYDWNFSLGWFYEWMLKSFPILWDLFYIYFDSNLFLFFSNLVDKFNLAKSKDTPEWDRWDEIILTIPTAKFLGYRDRFYKKTKIIITDYGKVSKGWLSCKAGNYQVCDKKTKIFLENHKVLGKIIIKPLPINSYVKELLFKDKLEIRKNLNVDIDKKLYPVIGGGAGDRSIYNLSKKLIKRDLTGKYIVFICGRNIQMYKYLIKKVKELKVGENVRVEKYIDNKRLLEYYYISEWVFSKPGGISTTEITQLKTKIAVCHYYKQEKGNIEYIINNKFGLFIRNQNRLIDRVFQDK